MLVTPVGGQARHCLHGARLLEQVRGAGNDGKLHGRAHAAHRRAIEGNDLLVVAADNQQRRRLHARQGVARRRER